MTAKALKLLWDVNILLVQERAASIQDACIRKLEAYKVLFGNEPVTQWEFPVLYSVAVVKALTRKNLKACSARKSVFSRLCLAMHD